MKLTIDSQRLYKKCQAAAKTVPSKATVPAYLWLLIEADAFSGITLTAANEAERATYLIEDVTIEGDAASFCIEAAQLLGILRELPQQPITIETTDKQATVRWSGGNGKAEIPVYSAEEFPSPDFKYSHSTELPAATLRDIAQSVHFAVAEDELRPVMSGTLYDFVGGKLIAVGSDGHALVRMTVNGVGEPALTGGDERKNSVIVPRYSFGTLGVFVEDTLRADKEAVVRMEWSAANVSFSTASASVVMRLAEGNYPNYNSVIPVNNPFNAIVDRLSLIAALRRVLVFAQKTTSRVQMRFEDGTLTVEGCDTDYSTSSTEHLPAQVSGADKFVVAVNGNMLIDCLAHLSTAEVVIEGSNYDRALLLTGVDDEKQLLMLLMPMQLNE